MPESRSLQFLKIAVKSGVLTSPQAEQILSTIEQRGELGMQRTPAEIAIEKGFLRPEQIETIESALRATLPPEKIAGFQVLDRIGRGAVGTVYRARQLSLDKIVALKVLHPSLTAHPRYVRQFIDEARAAASLNHPHIVQAIDAGEEAGYNYFAMEYVEGASLRGRLQEKTALPETELLALGHAVAQGLDHAHRSGLLHRDLKPDNILLGKDGQIKIADFGLAIPVDDVELLTEEHKRMGSPFYMSPEQAEGKHIEARSDLYSLGATLYHCALGKPPFTGNTLKEILTKQVHQEPVPLREAGAKVSADCEELIMKLIAKDPDARFVDSAVLVEAFHALRYEPKPVAARAAVGAVSRGPGRTPTRASVGGAGGGATSAPAARTSTGGGTKRTSAPLHSVALGTSPPDAPRPTRRKRSFTLTYSGIGAGILFSVVLFGIAMNKNQPIAESDPTLKASREASSTGNKAAIAKRIANWTQKYVDHPRSVLAAASAKYSAMPTDDADVWLDGLWAAMRSNATNPDAKRFADLVMRQRAALKDLGIDMFDTKIAPAVQALLERNQLAAALELLQRLEGIPGEVRANKKFKERVDSKHAEISKLLDDRWADDEKRMLASKARKDFAGAIAVLEQVSSYGTPDLILDAEKKRLELVADQEKYLEAERQRLLKEDTERYKKYSASCVTLAVERDYKGCVSAAVSLQGEVADESVKQMLEADLVAFQYLDEFERNVLKGLENETKSSKKKSFSFKLKNKDKYSGTIHKVERDKIWLTLDQGAGAANVPLELVRISDESMFAISAQILGEKSAQYLVPLGVLFTYRGQLDVAADFFDRAKQNGHDTEKWQKKVEWVKKNPPTAGS